MNKHIIFDRKATKLALDRMAELAVKINKENPEVIFFLIKSKAEQGRSTSSGSVTGDNI